MLRTEVLSKHCACVRHECLAAHTSSWQDELLCPENGKDSTAIKGEEVLRMYSRQNLHKLEKERNTTIVAWHVVFRANT